MSVKSMVKNIAICLPMMVASHQATAGFLDSKFEKEVETEKVAVKLVRDTQRSGYQLITTAELKEKIDQNQPMIIVDAMPYEGSYVKGHVPGAVSFEFPIKDMLEWDQSKTAGKSQQEYQALLGADKTLPVVVYCGFVKCGRSHNAADWAVKLGYKNVYRYPGGIFAWKGAGYPVAK